MITVKENVRRRNVEERLIRQKTISGKVDDNLNNVDKIPTKLRDVFKEVQRKKVLMEGAPGCGKSTLSLYICQQWSDGQLFQEYKLVILVRLREPPIRLGSRSAMF